jgi:hypothetical protein
MEDGASSSAGGVAVVVAGVVAGVVVSADGDRGAPDRVRAI